MLPLCWRMKINTKCHDLRRSRHTLFRISNSEVKPITAGQSGSVLRGDGAMKIHEG